MPQGWDNKLVMTFCNANKRAWELEGTGHKMLTPPSVDPNMEPNSITPETDNGCLAMATTSCPKWKLVVQSKKGLVLIILAIVLTHKITIKKYMFV